MTSIVSRRRLSWLVSAASVVLGWLAAHAVAYRLAEPHAHERSSLLAETGHGYLALAPAIVALCVVLALAGLGARVVESHVAGRRGRGPRLLLGLLPPLAFVLQEHLERAIHTGVLSPAVVLEPTFLIGLLLQLPFAPAAILLARALLAGADVLGEALAATPRVLRAPALAVCLSEAPLAQRPALASGQAQRAPPSAKRA